MRLHSRMLTLLILIAVAFGSAACTSVGPNRTIGSVVDDSVVTSRVKAALVKDEIVSGYAVEVDTYEGVVQLSGFVKSHEERMRAIKLARNVKGVKEVRDAMIVKR